MCNCYDEIKAKVKDKIAADNPDASDIEIELNGYVFALGGHGVTHRSSNELKISFRAPKKNGGLKMVRQTSFVRASFCPFCGASYSAAESAAA